MYTKKLFYFLAFILVALQCAWSQSLITPKVIHDRIEFLASDQMKGRFPGSKESWTCARYIRSNFKTAGLKPLGKHYFQYFNPTVKLDTGKDNHLQFDGFSGKLINDYIPLSFSARKSALSAAIIFCGYGLQLKLDSAKIDDYRKTEIKGQWVMLMRGLPESLKHLNIPGDSTSDFTKAKLALRRGVAGVIFVNNEKLAGKKTETSPDVDDLQRLRPHQMTELGIPVIQIKRRIANLLLKSQNKTIQQLESGYESKAFKIATTISCAVDIKPLKVKTANVVGVVEGSDPELKDEYIVLGAHYDHLGMGGYGTGSLQPDTFAIHNGADDNASGTAAVMTVAAQLANDRHLLKRSVIIIAFSAEEEGLLGSDYFVNHPLVPKEEIKVMINLDMVGHLDKQKELYIGGCGTFDQGIPLLDSLKKEADLKVYVISGGVGGSDHVSFYRKNIAVLGMHTGGHPEYHTPKDDLETLNIPGEAKVCSFVYNVVRNIANIPGKIEFVKQHDN